MPPMLVQNCAWPGVDAIATLQGTISHGVGPSTFVLTTFPQTGPISPFGDLTLGDGIREFKLKNCRVSRLDSRAGSDGQTWTLEIEDRRWAWAGLGGISGHTT